MTSPTSHGGWRDIPTGVRVVLRHRLAEPEPGGPHLTDVLGTVARVDDEGVVVETRHGAVRVPGPDVVLWKPVPPAPERRGARS
ncbi:hypothetical protein KIN34_00645 [Cellulomonas sp. DKR-3]|uniref:Histone acetyltransferase Rv0428c-like SH3 domain-containing protein n=1 Tax=Cellulomonas fulva TaxID=2835530 RepID=A0ABS5TUK4_9CELL|nr:hypothetical protein [Cellulomonas fulva]MBT0992799.1 hypothetical protein [Cellulomonas fulva]